MKTFEIEAYLMQNKKPIKYIITAIQLTDDDIDMINEFITSFDGEKIPGKQIRMFLNAKHIQYSELISNI